MAIFDGKKIKGIVGNVVFKSHKGNKNTIVQQAPVEVKQSTRTKRAGKIFGQASVLSATVRRAFSDIIIGCKDPSVSNRLNTTLYAILRRCFDADTGEYQFDNQCLQTLTGFEFNSRSWIANSLYVTPEIEWSGTDAVVTIPELDIKKEVKFPGASNVCELQFIMTCIAWRHGMIKEEDRRSILLNKKDGIIPLQKLQFTLPEECLCILGIGLTYFNRNQDIRTLVSPQHGTPAAICGANLTEGTFNKPESVKEGNITRPSTWTLLDKMRLGKSD